MIGMPPLEPEKAYRVAVREIMKDIPPLEPIAMSATQDHQKGTNANTAVDTQNQNPKKAYGDKKPALAQVPLVATTACSLALMDGANKYGARNWRENPVEAMTYVNAALRHLLLWAEGDEVTRDTGVHNMGAVMACCAILIDAQVTGNLIDNRMKNGDACSYLSQEEATVELLNETHKERLAQKERNNVHGVRSGNTDTQ